MKIDRDTIIKYLQAKGVNKDCPRCGKDMWNLPDNPSPWLGYWLADNTGKFSMNSSVIAAAMLVCENCGFISPHSHHYIAEWVEEQKSDGSK